MDLKKLVELADVNEMQAFAYTGYLNGKVSEDELQNAVDNYCENLADSFISQHKEILNDRDMLISLRRYISSIHADNPHSGYRFYEALYKKLQQIEPGVEKL